MSATPTNVVPPGPTKVCPKCGMAVPLNAYVCAHRKKRLRTGPAALGCAAVFGLLIVIVAVISSVTSEPPSSSAAPSPPARTLSADEIREQEKQRKAEEDRFLKTKAGRVWAKHRDWDRELCQMIAERKIRYGMTTEQVRAAWGKPESINSTAFPGSVHEQWVYGVGNYVYFENGLMTSLQQTK